MLTREPTSGSEALAKSMVEDVGGDAHRSSLSGRREGKVRDIYSLPAHRNAPPRLLIVASDRISAFDVVLPTPIPGKGILLTEIARSGLISFAAAQSSRTT